MNKVNALKLYKGDPYPITDKITLQIPTVSDLADNEDGFWFVYYAFVGNSTMRRLQLWESGYDWNKISNYEMFCGTIPALPFESTRLFFGDIDFTTFACYEIKDVQLDELKLQEGQEKPTFTQKRNLRFHNFEKSHTLYSQELDIEITAETYHYLSDVMREMLHIYPKDEYTVGKTAKNIIIDEERELLKRRENEAKDRLTDSTLQPLISAAVNSGNYPYKIDETFDLKVNQFMDCVARLQLIENTRSLLRGVMGGFVDGSKIKKQELDFTRPLKTR